MSNAVKLTDIVKDEDAADPLRFNSEPQRIDMPGVEGGGFNEYGVRENEDGSIDVRYTAMRPGVRNNFEIKSSFLQTLPDNIQHPVQYDHSQSQRANVGWIDAGMVKYVEDADALRLQLHVPNTGSDIRNDTIADFTHEPPAIQDGSIGLDPRTVRVEPTESDETFGEIVEGQLQEFSLTPFPAGYDSGGVGPAFADTAALDALTGKGKSLLRKKPYTVREI